MTGMAVNFRVTVLLAMIILAGGCSGPPPTVDAQLDSVALCPGRYDQILYKAQHMTEAKFNAYLEDKVVEGKVRWCGRVWHAGEERMPIQWALQACAAWRVPQRPFAKGYQVIVDMVDDHPSLIDDENVVFWLPLADAELVPEKGEEICFEGIVCGAIQREYMSRPSSCTVRMRYLARILN